MTKATSKLLVRSKTAARGAYDRLETKVMAAAGRRWVGRPPEPLWLRALWRRQAW
jgi:hypothetical protein